jgi:alpha,alpha-trehalose phosphorylase
MATWGYGATWTKGSLTVCPARICYSVYDVQPLTYGEPGYGYPESGQTIVNVTNGKLIRLLVDDEPFDVRYGELLSHERIFDLRARNLVRRAEWRTPAGRKYPFLRGRPNPPGREPLRRK